MFWWYMCIYLYIYMIILFLSNVCPPGFMKRVRMCWVEVPAPRATHKSLFLLAISRFLWRPSRLHNVDLLWPLNTEPLGPPIRWEPFIPHQVSPATAGNECSFNLCLIAEWHFPFLLLPSSYPPDLSGKIQLARIGARRLTLHYNNDVN